MEDKNKINVFAKRLRELRVQEGITQTQLASKLNIRQQSYLRYELGTGEPSLSTLREIALFFNVSTDYLLGITDY